VKEVKVNDKSGWSIIFGLWEGDLALQIRHSIWVSFEIERSRFAWIVQIDLWISVAVPSERSVTVSLL
jgi:hypothetical protein